VAESIRRQEHLFVVRIWKESDHQGLGSGWRGLAQHISSGQQIYFTSLRDMNDFIALKSGLPSRLEGEKGAALPGSNAKRLS